MDEAKLVTDPEERAQVWGDITVKLTELAPAVNWIWDKDPAIRSENVVGVIDEDNATWSLAHTSIK